MDLRYLLLAVAVGTSACASTGAVPRPYPGLPAPAGGHRDRPARDAAAPSAPGLAAAEVALSLLGAPYRNGGADPDGFDCSGFVQYVFARAGTALPRSVANQAEAGEPVAPDEVEAGDLVFFETGGGVSHVGIALGDGTFVHAPSSGGVVRVERLDSAYWSRRYAGARKVTGFLPTPVSRDPGTAATSGRPR